MRVLVLGGTGFLGTALTLELHDRGHDVTVLARSPDDVDFPDSVTTVAGDVTDPGSLAPAFEGRDAVVNLVSLSPLFQPRGGSERHREVHLDGTAHAVAAAESNGVERFVQVSALGADPDGPTAYIRAKGAAERVVRGSTLDWVVVRPSVVFGDGGEFVPFTKTLTTPYLTGLPGGGRTRFQPIWLGDLAPMLADAVVEDAHVGQTYELGGPEVLTLADVTRLAYRAEGRSVRVLPVPMALARAGLIAAGAVPWVPFGPDQYRSLQFDNTVTDDDVTAFGVEPGELRTLGDHLGVDADDDDGDSGDHARAGSDGAPSPDDGRSGPGRPLVVSRPVLLAFALLAASSLVPYVVDVYTFVGFRLAFMPSYLVTLLVYDSPFGLENVVYAVETLAGVESHLLWEAGRYASFYLVALLVGWVARRARGENPANGTPA